MPRPEVFLALPGTVRVGAIASLRQGGWSVIGQAGSLREGLIDPAFVAAGLVFYDADDATPGEVEVAAKLPCSGLPVQGRRAFVPVLDPGHGLPVPSLSTRVVFTPAVRAEEWSEQAALVLARRSLDPLRVVTVASPFGGCGKTTVAQNLAALLHYRLGASVALLDFAAEGPLVRNLIPPSAAALVRSVTGVARALRDGRDVAQSLRDNMVAFKNADRIPGLPALLGPPLPQDFDERDVRGRPLLVREAYDAIVSAALERWDMVVIDTSQDVSLPGNAAAMAAADMVLAPVIPGVAYMREWPSHMPVFMAAMRDGDRQNKAWMRVLFNMVNERLHEHGLAMAVSQCGVQSIGRLRVSLEEVVASQEASDIPVVRFPRGRVVDALLPMAKALASPWQSARRSQVAGAGL